MNTFLQKVTSRKLLIAIAGLGFGIAIAFGVETPEGLLGEGNEVVQAAVEIAKTISGALTALVSVWKYIDGEAKVDAARVNGK